MVTAKQTELLNMLLSQINEDEKLLCEPVINYLIELGYTPKKHKKSTFSLEFEKYGRIIAKLEIEQDKRLIFWLRFSASENYSEIFQEAVKRRPEAWIKRHQEWVNHDVNKCCGLCKGRPRLYHHVIDDGSTINRCGGYTMMVPCVTSCDVPEILRLVNEQDAYFLELLG